MLIAARTRRHNLGLGGSAVVTILRRPAFFRQGAQSKDRFGYNAGYECKRITQEELDRVRSKKHYSEYLPARL